MKALKRLSLTALLIVSLPLQASDTEIGLPPFPQGTIEKSSEVEDEDVRVFTAAVREVGGELRASDEIRRDLSGIRRTIGAGRNYSVSELETHYRAMLKEREATILFRCDGRSCGSSNVWANRVFGESRLYGRDDEQAYIVSAWLDTQNRVQLNTLYIVQRGNRQVYAYEQAFRLPEGETLSGVDLDDRRVFGPVIIRWEDPDSPSMRASSEDFRRVTDMASDHEDGTLYLVGFSPLDEGSLDDVMGQTESAVSILKEILSDRGISRDRMKSKVVGPMVQTSEAGRVGRRIEVMLIQEEARDD